MLNIRKHLHADGFVVHQCVDYSDFSSLVTQLGRSIAVRQIKFDPSQRAQLASREAMSLHTDHPDADFVAWYCVSQSEKGGESTLLDFRRVERALDIAALGSLKDIRVRVPEGRFGLRADRALLEHDRVCYADWLIEEPMSATLRAALHVLKAAISELTPINIRLRPGNALIVDNRRVLHGRTGFSESGGHQRLLVRHWISERSGA